MHDSDRHRFLPDANRLSMLAALILLAYALGRFVSLPSREWALQLPGFYLAIQVNSQTFIALLVSGLTASGAQWLLQDHPALRNRIAIEHWLLPALTAWGISLPLFQLPAGLIWWIGFALGGALLILVLVAEFIVVDPEDTRQPLAAAGLTAVSFALFLILSTALRFAELRLFMLLPAVFLAAGLVSLRTLHLRLRGQWFILQASIVTLITGQIAAALHYWPVTPVSFGLALLGPAYCLTLLVGDLAEGEPFLQAAVEPLVVLILIWGVALWIR